MHDSAEVERQFRYRMSVYLNQIEWKLSKDEAGLLNFLTAKPISSTDAYGNYLSAALKQARSFDDYITALQAAFEVYSRFEKNEKIENLYKVVETCLDHSPQLGVEISKSGASVTLFPKGAGLLDHQVVDQTLEWLSPHPKVLEPFREALKLHMDGDKGKQRNLLDNLRYSIEQLLKEILNNSKSLENQQKDLTAWFKDKPVHRQVINLYNQLLFGQFRQYQNDAVKHAGEYQEQDVEFMIYLAGTFMRLLLQLERGT